jgi:hypothetical protein
LKEGIYLRDIDELIYKLEIDWRIRDGKNISEVYGIESEFIIRGIIIEAMSNAGYSKGSIAHVLYETIDVIDNNPAKKFTAINNEFIRQKYKIRSKDKLIDRILKKLCFRRNLINIAE